MPGSRAVSSFILFLAGALAVAGCATETPSGDGSSLGVNLQLEGGQIIDEVEWVITSPGMDPMRGTIDVSAPGSTASVEVFGLPPGDDYTITMTAMTDDGESCSGSADFDVQAGESTQLMVILSCKPPEDLGGVRVNGGFNICADLVKMTVGPLQTSVGNDIELFAAGDDDENDPFELRWEATGGSIADPSAASTVYTCEEVGDHFVRVTVSDDGFDYCNCEWTVPITCVDGEPCENDADCGEGEVCDEGLCVPAPECVEDADCDPGEICVNEECVPDLECVEDLDCDPGEICVDNECVPDVECVEDLDCDPGEICVDNECVPDLECVEDADCDTGEICVDNECVPDLECVEDADCDTGEICVDNECVPDFECMNDAECDDDDLCTEGVCEAGFCSYPPVDCDDDNECTAESCDPATGCSYTNVADGTECDEGNGSCTAGECKTNELLGTDFVTLFEQNYTGTPALTLFLSGPEATEGVVSIASSGFSEPFTITPGVVSMVTLPSGSQVDGSDVIREDVAVRVTAGAQITVHGLNRIQFTTDAFAAVPIEALGRTHRVMAWTGGGNGPSQFAIAAIPGADGSLSTPTNVTITPSADAGSRLAGVPYTITLTPYDAYQLQSTGDLTGSLIESDRPIAVFGGNTCGNVPGPNTGFCDHLVEQIPPVTSWGAEALTVPLATRLFGDTFRIMAAQDGTTVNLDGPSSETFTLGAGEFEERILEGSYRITADAPVLVAQYSNGTDWDGVVSDPFMMLIPSAEQFVNAYTFATPGMGFDANYANVVALTSDAAANDVVLDGGAVPAGSFTPLAGTPYSAAQLPIAVGSHTLTAPNPLGLYVYGYASFDSYGYPGGFSAPVSLP